MSTGTNSERITQNNRIINENNTDLNALKTKINNLPTSGDTTATAEDIAVGKTAVSKGVKITGTYTPPTVSLQSKDVTINQNGITTIEADQGYDGLSDIDVTVTGILDTSDATAVASDIANGKTAYVGGQKLTGTASGAGYTPDWSEIGYSTAPQSIIDKFNYSKNIFDNWDSSITSMNSKYSYNKSLVYMPLVDTSNVISMNGTFVSSALEVIPTINTSNVTNMSYMFNGCSALTSISLLNTSNVTNMSSMFYQCTSLTTIPLLNTSNVTDMSYMFYNSGVTTIPQLITSSVTNFSNMFAFTKLTTIPQLNASSATNMNNMFSYCNSLTNDSLNNILQMCITTTKILSSNKTLKYIGLSQTQAQTCQTLSNYNDFTTAGWSSGY